jgi:S-adenosyl methyltransferase
VDRMARAPAASLSPLESAVLAVLQDAGGSLPAREVCGRLGLSPSISSHLAAAVMKELARRGLVSREWTGRVWHYQADMPEAVVAGLTPPGVANPARVQDYWLGGKDNYQADREIGDRLLTAAPDLIRSVRENRYFLARAVRYLASEGIHQFLDIGDGLPFGADNTHEIAQRAQPSAHVVYVDNDPVVTAYGQALLISGPQGACDHVQADVRDPRDIIAGAADTLDFTQPVAILLLGVLEYIPGTDEMRGIIRQLLSSAAAGSYLVISSLTAEAGTAVGEAAAIWNAHGAPAIRMRTGAELTGCFDGLDVIAPGLVSCSRWRPDFDRWDQPADVPHLGGVGRKP